MTKLEKLINYIQELSTPSMVALHNEYCYATNNYDDAIFDNDNINEMCYGQDAYWIACRVAYGDYNPSSEYVRFNGYGNFQSIYNYNVSDYIDENEMADYIIENDEDFGESDIRYILDDIEEMEE